MARTHGARSTVVKADNLARRQAWTTMRIMRRFTRADVLTTATITKSNLDKYVKGLLRCGFLVVQQERVSGSPGSRDVLRIARDTGPRPPIMHKDGSMLDPNTGDTWYVPEEGEEQAPAAADATEGAQP
jgi:hypothetical protein